MLTRPFIIGVAGSSGAGKGFITDKIIAHYGIENCEVISFDSYYFTRTEPMELRKLLNFDKSDMLDTPLLVQNIKDLKASQSIACPNYDFTTHARTSKTTTVPPKPIIIVEGIFTLYAPELAEELDLKIFVETDQKICRQRRLDRDVKERGREPEDAARQFDTQVVKADEDFVRPSAKKAHVTIKNNSSDHTVDITEAIQKIDFLRSQVPIVAAYAAGNPAVKFVALRSSGEIAAGSSPAPQQENLFNASY